MASVTIPKFFKEYEGTVSDFITGYNAATAAKKAELDAGQVFIHDTNDNGLAIWAHGKLYALGNAYTRITGTNPAATSTSGTVTWNITHQLDSADVICIIKDASTGEEVDCNIIYNPTPTNNTYTITVSMNLESNIPAGSYMYVIIGGVTSTGGGGGGGTGSVTQINTGAGLTGGPITTTGTIGLASGYGDSVNPYAAKNSNTVLAGPASGNAAVPSFRALVAADIPDLSGTYAAKTHAHGNISNTGALTDTAASPATGDSIVIRDASDNKIQTSNLTFDTSDPNKYLSKGGNWHTAVTHHSSANTALTPTNGVAAWTVTHNLGTRHRITQVICGDATTTWATDMGLEEGQVINCRIVNTNVNTTTIYINTTTTIQADSLTVEIFAL